MKERAASEASRREDETQALASRLRESREYVGLSQEAVAQRMGVPRATISAVEGGKRKVSSIELRDFARLYRTSVETLLGQQQEDDPVVAALYRTTNELTDDDRKQVLKFAEFLRSAGRAPSEEGS